MHLTFEGKLWSKFLILFRQLNVYIKKPKGEKNEWYKFLITPIFSHFNILDVKPMARRSLSSENV